MANEIDLIVGNEAFAQITKLLVELNKVDTSFTELSAKFATLGNNTNTIKNTADLAKLNAENAKLNTIIEQQIKDFSDLNEKLAKVNTTRASSTKATLEETIANRELNAQKTLSIKAGENQAKTYAQLDAQHKIAIKNAQDLAVQTGRQGQAYEDAKLKANEFGARLRVIDTDIGKHTRNVGNYSSSWNGLGNSINQITREAPAFANSISTGFMALSNNLPILADEIGVIVQKNKDLQAEGKPTTSILKQLAAGFFSWQTLISIGVTLLTVYGSKLWEFATSGNKAAESQKKLNEEISSTNNTISPQIVQLQSLVDIVNSSTESEKNRQLAYEEIKKTLPGLTSATYSQAIATGELKTATDLYISSLIQQQLVEIQAKSIAEEQTKLNEKTSLSYKQHIGKVESWLQSLQPERIRKNLEKTLTEQRKLEEDNQQAIIDNRKKALVKSQEDFLKTQKALKPFITPIDKATKPKEDKIERDAIKSVNELQKVDTLLARINTEIKRLRVEKIVANEDELPAVNFQLEQLYTLKKQLNELPSVDLKIAIPEAPVEKVKNLTKEMENYLGSFGTEFASKAGFSETFNMLSGNIEGFGENAKVTFVAVAESAQEMFNMIAESSQASFDAEYSRLDKQKETAIRFAGDSTSAKEKVEADYAKRKHEIEVREFKQKQKITLANIAIDTAQAIVSTWAQVPKYDFGISATALSIMIGAMGAVQAGMVLTQKPPAYAEGTDNHSGGLMLVNDGAGSNFQEKIILPSGKVIRPQGRNVLMDAPKGTKVLNHEQQLFEMLQNNNISMNTPRYEGMTSAEMDSVLTKHFSKITTNSTVIDKNGFNTYISNGNSKTIRNQSRNSGTGFSV